MALGHVPAGGSASLTPSGNDQPASGLNWDIVVSATQNEIATSASPAGWAVGGNITISAPASAQVGATYEVRAWTGPIYPLGQANSATFQVVTGSGGPSLTGMTLTPTSAIQGCPASGLVKLSGAAPSGGVIVVIATSNVSVAYVANDDCGGTVTVPAGQTSAAFTIMCWSAYPGQFGLTGSTPVTVTAAYGGVTESANLTVLPATLASVSVSPTSITGGSGATGTVQLTGNAPASGTTVSLTSDNAALQVPSSAQIYSPHAGVSSAQFAVTTSAVSAAVIATITASAAGWVQSTRVPIVPTGYISIQNLEAVPGNGCVVLSWLTLTAGSVSGYNVYRDGTLLNTAPLPAASYADIGLANGTSHQYEVTAVTLRGTETAGQTQSAMPSSTVTAVSWISPPTGTVSGEIDIYASMPANLLASSVLVDGVDTGGAITTMPEDASSLSLEADVNTQTFPNGTHTIQIVGMGAGQAFATTPLTLTFSNPFSGLATDDLLDETTGDVIQLNASLPAGTATWTASVMSGSTTVASWSSSGSTAQVTWPGTGTNGSLVAAGDYTLQIASADAYGSPSTFSMPIHVLTAAPYAIAMVQPYENYGQKWDYQLAADIVSAYENLFPSGQGQFYLVWQGTATAPVLPARTVSKLRGWMGSSLYVFYLMYHGTISDSGGAMLCTEYRGLRLYANAALAATDKVWVQNHPDATIVVNKAVGNNHPYHFVWLDCCHSAGGVAWSPSDQQELGIAAPDGTWSWAFDVNPTSGPGVFVGWDGDSLVNTTSPPAPFYQTDWATWRGYMWYALSLRDSVYDAFDYATLGVDGSSYIEPWDWSDTYETGRFQELGQDQSIQ